MMQLCLLMSKTEKIYNATYAFSSDFKSDFLGLCILVLSSGALWFYESHETDVSLLPY